LSASRSLIRNMRSILLPIPASATIRSRSLAVGGTHHLVVALRSSYVYHLFPFIRASSHAKAPYGHTNHPPKRRPANHRLLANANHHPVPTHGASKALASKGLPTRLAGMGSAWSVAMGVPSSAGRRGRIGVRRVVVPGHEITRRGKELQKVQKS
jgi:hypothetical protein